MIWGSQSALSGVGKVMVKTIPVSPFFEELKPSSLFPGENFCKTSCPAKCRFFYLVHFEKYC